MCTQYVFTYTFQLEQVLKRGLSAILKTYLSDQKLTPFFVSYFLRHTKIRRLFHVLNTFGRLKLPAQHALKKKLFKKKFFIVTLSLSIGSNNIFRVIKSKIIAIKKIGENKFHFYIFVVP